MSVIRRSGINRLFQIQLTDNTVRTEIEHLKYRILYCAVGISRRAESVDAKRNRLGLADSIRDLKLTFIGESSRNDVFCKRNARNSTPSDPP